MKKEISLILILSLVVLTACASISNIPGVGGFFGGSISQGEGGRGVVLSFIEFPQDPCPTNVDGRVCILENTPFNLRMQVDNFVTNERGVQGQLCLEDDFTDRYGGIRSTEPCLPINLGPATETEGGIYETSDNRLIFGPYTYHSLPSGFPLDTEIRAKLKYDIEATAGALACAKRKSAQPPASNPNCGNLQNLQVHQSDLPLEVTSIRSWTTSLSEVDNQVIAEIKLSRKAGGHILTRGNFMQTSSAPAIATINFWVTMNSQRAQCIGTIDDRLELRQNENEKIIKCSSKVVLSGQDSMQVPIVINMGYGYIQTTRSPTKLTLIKQEELIA